ncbi:MAG TPA: bifunctional 2-polyprenyl-6-hydroxyphenol methylase/3-demethylubiquinol 3-O-methyltransferase UbiG [Stellaceae bacterium]|nr:bifunctional 2-polyprenyl-6-hydroxyphenol methylase/3-demethylubiquinol 3-O-methyltransferase UbiG [Stellaceae bacterium]
MTNGTVDSQEIAHFAGRAHSWWDPQGSFRPLHRLNPTRIFFIRDRLAAHFGRDGAGLSPFSGLRLLDIGCGGGLIAEPMARLGFAVVGIDADAAAIAVARAHAEESGLAIDYRVAAAESLADQGERFDAVLGLEIIEHVADPAPFFAALGGFVRPGGAFVGATINRTPRAFALAVVGAEYILRWLPRGTHDWRKFVRPSEFVLGLRRNGFAVTELSGVSYDILSGNWRLSPDLEVNYMLMAVRHCEAPQAPRQSRGIASLRSR